MNSENKVTRKEMRHNGIWKNTVKQDVKHGYRTNDLVSPHVLFIQVQLLLYTMNSVQFI